MMATACCAVARLSVSGSCLAGSVRLRLTTGYELRRLLGLLAWLGALVPGNGPVADLLAGVGAFALLLAGLLALDVPGVARPAGEPFPQPGDVWWFQRAHGGEGDLGDLVQVPGEVGEVLAVQRGVQAAGEADQLGRAVCSSRSAAVA